MLHPFFNHESRPHLIELLVLGIGSPFGDDQLGWDVVKLLEQSPALQPMLPDRLALICCDRPGMHLLELMKPAQTVFLIDAVKTGAAIGTLHRFQNQDIETVGNALSTHGLGVAEAMKMGAILNTLPPTVILYGIEIGDNPLQFTLSKPIEEAVKALVSLLEQDILIYFGTQL